jgi:hypothetical protein
LSWPNLGSAASGSDEEMCMQRETAEIQAVWHERPGLFTSGMVKWVAVAAGPSGAMHLRESTAFPLDSRYVDDDPAGAYPYIRIVRDEMDAGELQTVDRMLAEFVELLEHEGWVRTGQGADWFNIRFTRHLRS